MNQACWLVAGVSGATIFPSHTLAEENLWQVTVSLTWHAGGLLRRRHMIPKGKVHPGRRRNTVPKGLSFLVGRRAIPTKAEGNSLRAYVRGGCPYIYPVVSCLSNAANPTTRILHEDS